MKTTLDIPEKLLAETMKAAGATTKRDAVLRALEDFNRRARLRKLTERLGRSETFMSPEELHALRSLDFQKQSKTNTR
ncbi:MAG TPA: type II toxin-antitoxin system VapB family antitoxin [Chthoniobacteraceae bacterium]|nr:type II toxin-antitoxin system VapB family antitoxin [Chthoniobacteraceae bacterium]